MQNNNLQNSHNNPELPVPSASTPAASVPSTELAKKLLPPSVRDRKFRALSFGSKLNPVQLSTLAVWLSKDSIEQVRQKVAAPPPQGFGIQVCGTTLRRIKKLVDNSVCTTTWVSDAMDTACDLLDAEDAAEVTPLREALGLLLYSRAVRFAEEQAPVEQIDKLLSAITKLEKLKAAATSAPRTFNRETPREIPPPTTRHIVELSVTPAPSSAPAKIVSVTAQSVRDPAENSPEPPKR